VKILFLSGDLSKPRHKEQTVGMNNGGAVNLKRWMRFVSFSSHTSRLQHVNPSTMELGGADRTSTGERHLSAINFSSSTCRHLRHRVKGPSRAPNVLIRFLTKQLVSINMSTKPSGLKFTVTSVGFASYGVQPGLGQSLSSTPYGVP